MLVFYLRYILDYSSCHVCLFFFFKQKTAYEMRISDWSSDVCSSDLCSHANMAVNATTLSYCRHDFRRSNHAMVVIRHAIFPRDTASVLGIWREFIANSPVNLYYQNNYAEFANLPGKYAAPKGCVLLADREGEIEG